MDFNLVTIAEPNVFNIGEIPKSFGEYVEGGRAKQVKVPSFTDFKPLEAQLGEPECVIWDYAHFDAPAQLNALWQALYAFEQKHGRAPRPRNDEDVADLKSLLPAGSAEVSDTFLRNFSYQVR